MPPSPVEITFWVDVASPHMMPMIRASAGHFDRVRVFTTERLDDQRRSLGWDRLSTGEVDLRHLGSDAEVDEAVDALRERDSAHIFSGLGAYPRVARARRRIARGAQVSGILAEVPDPAGTLGMTAKKLRDALELRRGKHPPHFIGAIGAHAFDYYHAVAPRRTEIFEFGYFPELGLGGSGPAGIEGQLRLAAVGSLMPHKGFDLLIEALARLQREDVTLTIAGSGPDEPQLRDLAGRLGLGDRVAFAGLIPPAQVPEFMRRADLAVMPSRYDGWGAVVNEALAVGTPVLVSEACGARSLVSQETLGAVVPSGSVEALAAALLEAVQRLDAFRAARPEIAGWAARSIAPSAGARYLADIVRYAARNEAERPVPCWTER